MVVLNIGEFVLDNCFGVVLVKGLVVEFLCRYVGELSRCYVGELSRCFVGELFRCFVGKLS